MCVFKEKFIEEFLKIPKDCLYGLHIHTGKHQPPKCEDKIPWHIISKEINSMEKHKLLHLLPEVHHSSHVVKTYKFCKNKLKF